MEVPSSSDHFEHFRRKIIIELATSTDTYGREIRSYYDGTDDLQSVLSGVTLPQEVFFSFGSVLGIGSQRFVLYNLGAATRGSGFGTGGAKRLPNTKESLIVQKGGMSISDPTDTSGDRERPSFNGIRSPMGTKTPHTITTSRYPWWDHCQHYLAFHSHSSRRREPYGHTAVGLGIKSTPSVRHLCYDPPTTLQNGP